MPTRCLNCNNEYSGKFCPQCGQKSNTHKITLATIVHDIPHSVFHLDKGIPYTLLQLLYRPGTAIKEYLDGKRMRFFSPLGYLFFLAAISSFINHEAADRMHGTMPANIMFPKLSVFFNHYPALMFCILAPFIAFWSWVFNRDKPYNYWENLVLNIYLIAQFNLFFIVNTILQITKIYTSPKVTAMLVCFMVYIAFAYAQFFKSKVTTKRIIKNVGMFLFIVFTLLTGLTLLGFMTPWW